MTEKRINCYSTVGAINKKQATFLVFADSISLAHKTIEKANNMVANGAIKGVNNIDFDVDDLQKVTDDLMWGSANKWIAEIIKSPDKNRLADNVSIYYDFVG